MKTIISTTLKKLKPLVLLMAILTTTPQFSNAQCNFTQLGIDIDGEADEDYSGYSVSLSADGLTVAIGAPYNAGGGINRGHVRVYKNISGTWTQQGADIDGEANGDESGRSVSLSADGLTVAIGAPYNAGGRGHVRVYKNISGTWTQLGVDIDGESNTDNSGYSVSLSSDGLTVAIGAPSGTYFSFRGHVRVYKNISGTWMKQGADIDGEADNDASGQSVSLSADGLNVAIGSPNNSGGGWGWSRGHVRVFKYISDTWTKQGANISGEEDSDLSGQSVSLSADGLTVAIGAPGNYNNSGFDRGHVRVYKKINGIWTQQGTAINRKMDVDWLGWAVSLSSDGLTVAIGAFTRVRVYKNINSTWTQQGSDLDGEVGVGSMSVSLAADGLTVASGWPYYTPDVGNKRGHVSVYQCNSNVNVFQSKITGISIYPNPFNETLNLDLKLKDGETADIAITDMLGKTLLTQSIQNNQTLDLKSLNSGVYMLSVQIESNLQFYKVIKQ
jgi:hypothetical protein